MIALGKMYPLCHLYPRVGWGNRNHLEMICRSLSSVHAKTYYAASLWAIIPWELLNSKFCQCMIWNKLLQALFEFIAVSKWFPISGLFLSLPELTSTFIMDSPPFCLEKKHTGALREEIVGSLNLRPKLALLQTMFPSTCGCWSQLTHCLGVPWPVTVPLVYIPVHVEQNWVISALVWIFIFWKIPKRQIFL